MLALLKKVEERSTGLEEKKQTYQVQFTSAIIFLVLGIYIYSSFSNLIFSILFLSEAVGQIFLAYENMSSLKKGMLTVRYFKRNTLGLIAYLAFAPVIIGRFYIVSTLQPNHSLLILATGCILYLCGLIYFQFIKGRNDFPIGVLFTISAILMGLCYLLTSQSVSIGVNQLLYALLIILGPLFFKPSRAEMINIVLWIHLFIVIGKL